jgi:cytidyltransferase-like protein
MVYSLVASGGTFDHFHKGHEHFLSYGLSMGKNILIGITSDNYVKKVKADNISSIEQYDIRKQSVIDFLKKTNNFNRSKIISIDDQFGPTLSREIFIDGLVVSKETEMGADLINEKRKKIGLMSVDKLIAPQFFCEDNNLLSSARIRSGEVSRHGRLYANPIWLKTSLGLPDKLRKEFGKPFGEIVKTIDISSGTPLIITVGDETSKYFNSINCEQNISVVDLKIKRKLMFSSVFELGFSKTDLIININNPAGCISKDAFVNIANIVKQRQQKKIVIKVNGEEDLLVLPMILVSPLNSLIYYGQPDVGMVKILVTEKIKDMAYDLASQFEPIRTHTRGY